MKRTIYYCVQFFLILLLAHPQSAIAAPSRFSNQYVEFYHRIKTTHDLANVARTYKTKNPSVDLLIQQIKSNPPQKLPRLRVRGHQLHFETPEGIRRLKHVSGTRFLLDEKPIDLAADFSQSSNTSSIPWSFIPEAHAVAPLFWVAVIIVTAVVGSAVCFNSSVENFFEEKQIAAKWVRPGEFNRYMRKLKEQLKPICPGAAWAEKPSDYDYEDFFRNYCAQLKISDSSAGFKSSIASMFMGTADEGDQALIQAASEDKEFMKTCIQSAKPRAAEDQESDAIQ